MSEISDELYDFLKAYAKWAYEDGAPAQNEYSFANYAGLCSNFRWFVGDAENTALIALLMSEFPHDHNYPFGGNRVYNKAYQTYTQHRNPRRKEWVLRKIKEYERAHQ